MFTVILDADQHYEIRLDGDGQLWAICPTQEKAMFFQRLGNEEFHHPAPNFPPAEAATDHHESNEP